MKDHENEDGDAGSVRERRKGERRKRKERREMVRWEPDKEDRRSGKDRRKNANDVWKWRDL